MLLDEHADVVRHVEELGPLLLVERDRESAQSIDGDSALVADLERRSTHALALQRLVFRPQALDLGSKLILAHRPPRCRRSNPPALSESIIAGRRHDKPGIGPLDS